MGTELDAIVSEIMPIKTGKEMKDFLAGLLTQKEIGELAKRIRIIKLLKENIPQHEIARKLKVGVSTVTRGSKELSKGRFKYV